MLKRFLAPYLAALLAVAPMLAGLAVLPAPAQAQTAAVLASCGSASYAAGTFNSPTMDTTGRACGGVNGDPVRVVASCGSASYTAGTFNYPTADTTGVTCANTGAAGTVTTTGSPSNGQYTQFSGATSITTATGAADTMLGNWTGSTGNIAANAMPSCSDTGGNHLNYVSGTGVTCGTSGSAAAAIPNQLSGLGLANDSGTPNTVIDIAAGQATDSTNATSLVLGSAFTKSISSTFTAGTGNGCLDTGAVANATWYHVFIISKAGGANVDILCSTSATAPTMPSTYTLKRRLGSLLTDGSAHFIGFTQLNDRFIWKVNVKDLSTVGAGVTSGTLTTLSVPSGVQVVALFTVYQLESGANVVTTLWTSPDDTDTAPDGSDLFNSIGASTTLGPIVSLQIRTNTSSQIRRRNNSTNNVIIALRTYGWIDDRGMSIN